MRPTRLELKNFGSYRGRQIINFDDVPGNLFAIAGPIGSGKSTLLDAIMWALYGQTPRLGRQLNEHIMTPGETDLVVVLEFTARGETLRATRALHRTAAAIKPDYKLERQKPSGAWVNVPEADKRRDFENAVVRYVGLDYDAFTRAVVLPQGAFDEFLRGDAGKRQELFKKLLNAYTIEEMRDRAYKREGHLKAEVGQHQARLDEYDRVTEEREAELKTEISDMRTTLNELAEELRVAREENATLDTLRTHHQALRAALKDLTELEKAEASIQEDRAHLERAKAAGTLMPVVRTYLRANDTFKSKQVAVQDLEKTVDEMRKRVERLRSLHKEREEERTKQKPALEKALQALEASRDLATLLKNNSATLDLASKADGEAFRREDLERVNTSLAETQNLFSLEKALTSETNTLKEAEKTLQDLQERGKKGDEAIQDLVERGKTLRQKAEAAKRAVEDAQVENQALLVREHLHEGDACPVCLQTVTSLPETTEAHELSALTKAREDADAELAEALKKHSEYKGRLEGIKTQAKDLDERIRTTLKPNVDRANENLQKALAPHKDAGETARDIKETLTTQRQILLARLAKQVHDATGGRDYATAHHEHKTRLKNLEQAATKALEDLQEASAEHDRLAGKLDSDRSTLTDLETARNETHEDLQKALAASRFTNIDDVQAATLDETTIARIEARLEKHQKAKHDATYRKQNAEQHLEGHEYDPAHHEKIQTRIRELEHNERAQHGKLGGKEQELTTLQERLKDKKKLEKEIEALGRKHAIAKNLALALRRDKFEAYVLAHSQADLATTASSIIHDITSGRYELTYREKEFYVRDTWMDAHERSVKTLSGGESFIVSLALALALSDIIAGEHTLDALFLDEGFGTLDPETLDSVTDVLTNLTTNGRTVGVITHVTNLTDRLPARLIIENHPQRGSMAAWDY